MSLGLGQAIRDRRLGGLLHTKGLSVANVYGMQLARVDLVLPTPRVSPKATPLHRSRTPHRVAALRWVLNHPKAQPRSGPGDIGDVSHGPHCAWEVSAYARPIPTPASTIREGLGAGGVHTMRYLGIPAMPRRSLWASLRPWRYLGAEWHAVADTPVKPERTLCGLLFTTEAHRTWDQTFSDARCPQCQRLVVGAEWVQGATSIPEVTQPRESVSRVAVDAFRAQRIGQARRLHPSSDPAEEDPLPDDIG